MTTTSNAPGPAYWRRYLDRVPTWALDDEQARRREEAIGTDAIAIGQDFLVDPVGSLVSWRGTDYTLAGRGLEVVHALALAWLGGRRRTRPITLAHMVWRGRDREAALSNLRSQISDLRHRVPGLVGGGRVQNLGYHIDLPTSEQARRVPAGLGVRGTPRALRGPRVG